MIFFLSFLILLLSEHITPAVSTHFFCQHTLLLSANTTDVSSHHCCQLTRLLSAHTTYVSTHYGCHPTLLLSTHKTDVRPKYFCQPTLLLSTRLPWKTGPQYWCQLTLPLSKKLSVHSTIISFYTSIPSILDLTWLCGGEKSPKLCQIKKSI